MKCVQLSGLVSAVETWNPNKCDPDDCFQYIDLSAIDQETKSIVGARQIECRDAPSRARQLVRAGDILVSTVRPNLNGVAKVPDELDGATASTGFCVLRPNPELLDSNFLFQWVKGTAFVGEMVRQATGASYPAVSDRIVLASSIPLPSVSEQRRIAAILDQADALRAKRRKALAHLDSLTQSMFIEMFGDPVHGKSKANAVPFEEITTRITYGFTSPMSHLEAGIPILTAKNVQQGYLDMENVHYAARNEFDALTSKSKPQRGDILITKDGTIGRTAVVETDEVICINQSVALVQLQTAKVLPSYVSAYLQSSSVQRVMKNMGKGNALAHLQITELGKLPIGLPPLAVQAEFSKRMESYSALLRIHESSAEEFNSLFASLQHRAFQGTL